MVAMGSQNGQRVYYWFTGCSNPVWLNKFFHSGVLDIGKEYVYKHLINKVFPTLFQLWIPCNVARLHVTSPIDFWCNSTQFVGCLPCKVLFHQTLYFIKGQFPSKVIFNEKLSSSKGCLPLKLMFHLRSSSIQESLYPKGVVTSL